MTSHFIAAIIEFTLLLLCFVCVDVHDSVSVCRMQSKRERHSDTYNTIQRDKRER